MKFPIYFERSDVSNGKIKFKIFDVVNNLKHKVNDQVKYLNSNTAYYTNKIFKSLSDSEYLSLLSPYKHGGVSLLDAVDPKPKAISGNYLVFKLKNIAKEHEDWIDALYKQQEISSTLVPVPTGGVFAEAIQGRANSAEKLDITRFWNWQDSPLPHTAPDIAPIQSGSRATDPNVHPSNFSQPIVSISNGSQLPDPQGMGATLTAISSPNMFRDMSGMAHTASLALKALEEASTASVATGGQASENLAKGLDFTKELASQIIKMTGDYGQSLADTGFGAMTGAMSNGANANSVNPVSEKPPADVAFESPTMTGATINQAKDMDDASKLAEETVEKPATSPLPNPKKSKKSKKRSTKPGPQEKRVQDQLVGGSSPDKSSKIINLSVTFHDYNGTARAAHFEMRINEDIYQISTDELGVGSRKDINIKSINSVVISVFSNPDYELGNSHGSISEYYFRASTFLKIGESPNVNVAIKQLRSVATITTITTSEELSNQDFKEALLGGGIEVGSGEASSLIAAVKVNANFEAKWGSSTTNTNGTSVEATVYYPSPELTITQFS